MRKTLVRAGLTVTLLGGGFATGYAMAQQGHLKAGMDGLDAAEMHLKLHTPDTGGHAALALKDIASAKKHVNAAMKAVK
ncbi:MAG: hypothetical protein ABI647_14055 [Gemmatimonadota bacterium]